MGQINVRVRSLEDIDVVKQVASVDRRLKSKAQQNNNNAFNHAKFGVVRSVFISAAKRKVDLFIAD
jgi:hypothetical protein